MACNRIVSESGKVQELPDGSPGIKVDIKAMDQSVFFLKVGGHLGPIKIIVDFSARSEGDILMLVDKEKENLDEGSSEWTYRNKTSMTLIPKRVFDAKAAFS